MKSIKDKKPTVTQLLSLLDKPALLKWANKIGLEGISLDEYRKKSTKAGSDLHKEIELYIIDKKPFSNKEHQENFDRCFADKKIISIEKNIETDFFRGRMDVMIEYDGKKYVCDFKSSEKGIYFEQILQLIAYRMAENSDGIAIVQIPQMNFKIIEIEDYSPYEHILEALSIIYTCKQDTIQYLP